MSPRDLDPALPPSPAWDAPLAQAPLAFVDLEMTGLDPQTARVCEVCVVRTRGKEIVDVLESLVRPGEGAAFDPRSVAVHGIGAAELAAAPSFADLAPRLWALLDGAIVVGHGVVLDVAFLEAEFARVGTPVSPLPPLDTLPLARRCFRQPSYRLSDLAATLGIAQPRPHRAGDDARATLALFWRVVAELAPQTPRELAGVRVGERVARPEIVARAREAVAAAERVVVRYRPSHRPAQELPMVLTAVRDDIDPPRVLGYLEPGRGRRELRADRILAISPSSERDARELPPTE